MQPGNGRVAPAGAAAKRSRDSKTGQVSASKDTDESSELVLAGNDWQSIFHAAGRHALSVKGVSLAAALISTVLIYVVFVFLDAFWREQDASGHSPVSYNATVATPFSSSSIRPPLVKNVLLWGLLGILVLYAALIGTFVFLGPLLVTLRLHLFKFKMCGLLLLGPFVFSIVAFSNVLLAQRDAQRAESNRDIFTSLAYIAFATALIATAGRCIVSPMRAQLRGYILRPLLVAFVSMTATQGVAAIGSSFLLPLFAEASRLQRVVIRLVLFPVISELVLTAVRLVCRVAFTPSLASQYTIMWLTPPLLATSLLGRLLATNLTSLGEAIALAVMIALVERGMRFTMPHRDFAAERCLQACNWGQARGRARDALPEAAETASSTPQNRDGMPLDTGSTAGRTATDEAQDAFSPQRAVQLGLPERFVGGGTPPQDERLSAAHSPPTSSRKVLTPSAMPVHSVPASGLLLAEGRQEARGTETHPTAAGAIGDAQHLPPHHPHTHTHTHAAMDSASGDIDVRGEWAHASGLRDGTSSGDPHARTSSLPSVPSWTRGSSANNAALTIDPTRSIDVVHTAVPRGGGAAGVPPLHPSASALAGSSSRRLLLGERDSPSSVASSQAATSPGVGAHALPHIRAEPPRSGDAQVVLVHSTTTTGGASTSSGSTTSSMPLWRVWHSRRWNHFQNAYLEVDALSEDVGIMVSLPLALFFRLPPEPGAMPLSPGAVVLRVVLQLVIELLTELAPVFVVLLTRACSYVEAMPVSASHLAREVLKLPALRHAEIISTPTGIQLRLQETPKSKPNRRKRGSKAAMRVGVAAASGAGNPSSRAPLHPSTMPSASPATDTYTSGGFKMRPKAELKVRPSLEPLAVDSAAAALPEGAPPIQWGGGGADSEGRLRGEIAGIGAAQLSESPQEGMPAPAPPAQEGSSTPDRNAPHPAYCGSPEDSRSGTSPLSPGSASLGRTVASPLSPGVSASRTTEYSELSSASTLHYAITPSKPKRMMFGLGSKAQKPSQLDKSFSPAAAAAWYLSSPHPNRRRRSSAGSASTAFSQFGPANCCERACPRLALAFEDWNCACPSARRCAVRCTCRRICACSCLPAHLHRVLCHGPACSSLEAHKGERCCGSAAPRSTSSWLCALLKGPLCMFASRSWRLFLGCCLNDWDRSVLRESSIALRSIWAEDMAVERASLWQPFELTAVMHAVYDPERKRLRHDALRQGARNLLDDSASNARGAQSAAGSASQVVMRSPVEDAAACCCTRGCAGGGAAAVGAAVHAPRLSRLSGAFHWLGTVAEARTVKRLQAWELLPPGFRVLFVLMAASVVLVVVWQTMNVQLRCAYMLSPGMKLRDMPDAPLKFDFCS